MDTPQRGAGILTPSRRGRSHQLRSFPDESETGEDAVINTLCVIGDRLRNDETLMADLNSFGLGIIYSSENLEEAKELTDIATTAFIVEDFDGPDAPPAFGALHKIKATVLGPTAVGELASKGLKPSFCERPIYSHAMEGLGICFNKIKNKEDIRRSFNLIQNMGGSVLKEISTARVTHLVADTCSGDRYRYASTFGIPIMSGSWITAAWEKRHHPGFQANSREFLNKYKIKPFHGAKIYFLGFSEEERQHMVSEMVRNGGVEISSMGDPATTHVVVDDSNITVLPQGLLVPKSEALIVKSEWFWASIQMDACAEEKLHPFCDQPDPNFLSPQCNLNQANFSPSTPGRSQSGRKKKRRKEALSQLASMDTVTLQQSLKKRRSSVSELTMLSMSGSFLDTPSPRGSSVALDSRSSESNFGVLPISPLAVQMTPTKSPVGSEMPQSPSVQQAVAKMDLRNMTPRQHVFFELVQTEANYTNILRTILEVFKKPLEDPNMIGGQLLNGTEIKIIFGYLPPIYEVHTKMLKEFYLALQNWQDDFSIGNVYLRYAEDLLKAYPPYINFFEASKKMLAECDKSNPRFHAFLKRGQSKPECGRQSLDELMIRPVQRLPSVTLLLNDLLKHTKREKEHSDVIALDNALNKIKEVLTHINKDKQKTEGQVQIFKIFSDIENCPPHLVSSHRSFISKVDVIELGGSDELCGKGYELSIFLFSDVIEISKKRSSAKGLGLKSPSTMSLRHAGTLTHQNPSASQAQVNPSHAGGGNRATLKHVSMINLTAVKRVVDVVVSDAEAGGNVFALVTRTNQELKERMFVLQIVSSDEHLDKLSFLKQLCRHIANTMYRPDTETYLRQMRAEDLGLESSDLTVSNFGTRAYRSLHRKVNRAFSFDRTPTSVRLKRAVSSMISPLGSSSNQHQNNGCSTPIRSTPSSELQNLRLASCTNLMNAAESPKTSRFNSRRSNSSSSQPIMSPMGVMPPPSMPPLHLSATPKKGMASVAVSSPALSNGDSDVENRGFRTPNLCVRRPSLKLKAAAFLGFQK